MMQASLWQEPRKTCGPFPKYIDHGHDTGDGNTDGDNHDDDLGKRQAKGHKCRFELIGIPTTSQQLQLVCPCVDQRCFGKW